MPAPSPRPSLTTDLLTRYHKQRVGSTFDIRDTLNVPDKSPVKGLELPKGGTNETVFTTDGFTVKPSLQVTELIYALEANTSDAPRTTPISNKRMPSISGFTNKKYKP
jgi:hypothetical protein